MKLCGFCVEMGALIQQGVHYEVVPTANGALSLITSDDAEVQKKIWAFQDKTDEMMKKMAPPPEPEPEHDMKKEGK